MLFVMIFLKDWEKWCTNTVDNTTTDLELRSTNNRAGGFFLQKSQDSDGCCRQLCFARCCVHRRWLPTPTWSCRSVVLLLRRQDARSEAVELVRRTRAVRHWHQLGSDEEESSYLLQSNSTLAMVESSESFDSLHSHSLVTSSVRRGGSKQARKGNFHVAM